MFINGGGRIEHVHKCDFSCCCAIFDNKYVPGLKFSFSQAFIEGLRNIFHLFWIPVNCSADAKMLASKTGDTILQGTALLALARF